MRLQLNKHYRFLVYKIMYKTYDQELGGAFEDGDNQQNKIFYVLEAFIPHPKSGIDSTYKILSVYGVHYIDIFNHIDYNEQFLILTAATNQ